ncbi:MAG: hypothetical protein IPK04_06345 [Bdellovibrionales bacterium]|nr:hypothetical protein [Bdellovibrionales bacterium]
MFSKFRIFSSNRRSWLYSLISLLNVGCGLAVTGLIWYRYNATQESDILLLATSSISILAQLSLVGVEQVLYFYSDERKKSPQAAGHFFKLAFTWALVSGAGFACLFIVLAKYFLLMVGSGFSEAARAQTEYLLLCLSPQLVLSPALHVLRAKWALDEKFGRAYLLSAVNPLILLVCLVVTLVVGVSDLTTFGNLSLGIFVLFLNLFLAFNRKYLVLNPSRSDWGQIRALLFHSSMIKGANSVHGFLVQALSSSILSQMATGSISIFQYAKKLADGVFAITAGPQVMIYHSRCATAVSATIPTMVRIELRKHIIEFLKPFISLFLAMASLIYLITPFALALVSTNFSPPIIDNIRHVYLGIVLWYFILGAETLSVGVILATRSVLSLFGVNFVFILLFFAWSRFHAIEKIVELVITMAGFQLISFTLFTGAAYLIMKQRGSNAS